MTQNKKMLLENEAQVFLNTIKCLASQHSFRITANVCSIAKYIKR